MPSSQSTGVSLTSASARHPRAERGYVLLFFLLLSAFLVIGLYRVMPEIAFEGQRQKEEELIFRGMQYQRAIRLFVRQFGRYPTSLNDLINTNNMRFIRKLYADPMTKDGQWRLIHMGPGGVLLDSINPPVPVPQNCIGSNASSSGNASSANSSSGSGSSDNSTSNSSNGGGVGSSSSSGTGSSSASGCPSNSASSSSSSGSSGTGSSMFGSSPFTSSPGSATPNPNSTYQAPVTGQQTANGQNQGATSGSSGQPQSFGSGTIAGPIAGVASKSEAKSIRVWNTYTQYNHWEFIYNYLATAGTAAPASSIAGTNAAANPSSQSASPGVTTTPATTTPAQSATPTGPGPLGTTPMGSPMDFPGNQIMP